MTNIKNICVFAASSDDIPSFYGDAAYKLGTLIAKAGLGLVFGAGDTGLMGKVARGAKESCGKIIGIIPERLNVPGVAYTECTEFTITGTIHERKAAMEEISQAFIALPGGFGTFEELLEVITLKQLGYIDCPIVVLNTGSYYEHMNSQFLKLLDEGFAGENDRKLYHISNTPEEALEFIFNYVPKPQTGERIPLTEV